MYKVEWLINNTWQVRFYYPDDDKYDVKYQGSLEACTSWIWLNNNGYL